MALPEAGDAPGIHAYSQRLAKILNVLQGQKTSSIPAIRAAYFDLLKCEPAQTLAAPMLGSFTTALLASIRNENSYHGNKHFHEISLVGVVLTEAESKYGGAPYSFDEICDILMSHDCHDIFHTGRNNRVDARHVPCYMEARSYEAALPYLQQVRLAEDSIKTIRTAIYGTEAAQDPAIKEECGATRAQLVGRAYLHHFKGADAPILPENLKFLLDKTPTLGHTFNGQPGQPTSRGAKAARVAENMRIADIFSSLLNFESFKLRGLQLHEEFPEAYPDPDKITEAGWKGFIQNVVGGKTEKGNFEPMIASVGAHALTRHVMDRLFAPSASACDLHMKVS